MMQKLEAKLISLDACEEGIAEAMKYSTPQEAWEKVEPLNLIWIFIEIADDKTKHLFGLWSARQVQHLMTDPRSITALDVKEKWLKGEATDEELNIALEAARYARYARGAAARAAATAAAAYAAGYAADAAAYYAADAAAYASDGDAADAAADDAAAHAHASQATWIRENFTPDFEKLLG